MAHSDEEVIAAFRAAETVPETQINYDLLGFALSEFVSGGSLDRLLVEVERLGGEKHHEPITKASLATGAMANGASAEASERLSAKVAGE